MFAALKTIAYTEVKKTEKFAIPQLTTLKLQQETVDPEMINGEAD